MTTLDYQQIRNSVPFDADDETEGIGHMQFALLGFMQAGQGPIPPYWSARRDAFLRDFVRRCDPLSVTIGTFISKSITIPVFVNAVDTSVKRHTEQAQTVTHNLMRNSGIFKGFHYVLKQFVRDYLSQDNGAFLYVMGNAQAHRPLTGPAMGLFHLDSAHCIRTGDFEFPVIYNDKDGKRYRMHYTRVIEMASMPDTQREMNGVGYSPVSACIEAAHELKDITVYSQESFGSRPMRKALYARKGATLEQLAGAVSHAEAKMDSAGLTRFAKTLLMAPKNPNSELQLETLDLVGAPEGFDRLDVSAFDMALMAAAFGLDLNDLAMSFVSRNSNANAEVSDRKGWGKGVGEFMTSFVQQIDDKFLPVHLTATADTIDDRQDEQQARIWNLRSTARERDLTAGVTNVRTERERMLRTHEITRAEFEDMELLDGRLPDGTDVFALYMTTDKLVTELLALGVENPTIPEDNDPHEMLRKIHTQVQVCWKMIDRSSGVGVVRKVRFALAALEKLRGMYESYLVLLAEQMMQDVAPDTQNQDPELQLPESGDSQVISEQAQVEVTA